MAPVSGACVMGINKQETDNEEGDSIAICGRRIKRTGGRKWSARDARTSRPYCKADRCMKCYALLPSLFRFYGQYSRYLHAALYLALRNVFDNEAFGDEFGIADFGVTTGIC